MVNCFVQPSTFHLKGSSSSVLQIINHRVAKALSFCVLACLAFSFFPKDQRWFPISPADLQNCPQCLNMSFREGSRMFRKLSDVLASDRIL